MRQTKKKVFSILIIMILGGFITAQTNLLKNGDFKNGTEGWTLESFKFKSSDDGYNYVATGGFVFPGRMPYIMTDDQEINIEPGNTYIISFWGSGFPELYDMILKGSCVFILSDGTQEEYLEGVEGLDAWNEISFNIVDERNNGEWKKYEKEITFPKNIDVKSMIDFTIGINSSFAADVLHKKISEISISKKTDAPKGFKEDPEVFQQRYTKLNWIAESGKIYKVEVNGQTHATEEGVNSMYIRGLLPNTPYTAKIYSTDKPEDKAVLEFRTKDYIEPNQENRIPFLGNIENGAIPRSFVYHIDDLSGGKITNIDITYGGSSANINKDGLVNLPDGVNEGTLIVNITQEGGEKTMLTYKSITIEEEQ